MKDFQGKVAVVTGAASGIGRCMALDFARRGMKLVLADIEPEPLEAAGREAAALGAECATHTTDVSKLDSVLALADAAFERFGAVHVLCNNAGVSAGGVTLEATTHRDWQWVLGVNLWGVIHGLEAFLPRMIAQKQDGHIVNTGSILGLVVAWPRTGAYVASKFAVVDTHIYEAERNRPADLKVDREPVDLRARMAAVSANWITPEEVSAHVMRGIEEERFYIFTHGESGEWVDQRHERLRKDYLPGR